jgi:molybdopterin adenylyltransferase
MRAAIITVSSSRSRGLAEDLGGPALAAWAHQALGAEIAGRDTVDDDADAIAIRIAHWADAEGVELVLTTGGTGFGPADVTPEATRAVIEREAPGIAEAMRQASQAHTAHWMLSRAVAGIRNTTLIVNFPGSPKSITEVGAAIAAALPHAVAMITGESGPGASHVKGSSTTDSH